MQSLICGIATTLIQHKHLPFEVTVDNELPPLSLGCVRWRQLEVLPTKFVAVKVDFFVYENSSLPKKSVKSVDISAVTQQESAFHHE